MAKIKSNNGELEDAPKDDPMTKRIQNVKHERGRRTIHEVK